MLCGDIPDLLSEPVPINRTLAEQLGQAIGELGALVFANRLTKGSQQELNVFHLEVRFQCRLELFRVPGQGVCCNHQLFHAGFGGTELRNIGVGGAVFCPHIRFGVAQQGFQFFNVRDLCPDLAAHIPRGRHPCAGGLPKHSWHEQTDNHRKPADHTASFARLRRLCSWRRGRRRCGCRCRRRSGASATIA